MKQRRDNTNSMIHLKKRRKLSKLKSEEDRLKGADLVVQQQLLMFGQDLDEQTKKNQATKKKIEIEEKVLPSLIIHRKSV